MVPSAPNVRRRGTTDAIYFNSDDDDEAGASPVSRGRLAARYRRTDQGTTRYGGASNGDVFGDKQFIGAGVDGVNVNVMKTEGDIPWGFPSDKSCRRFDDDGDNIKERAAEVGERRRGEYQRHVRYRQEESTERKSRISAPMHDDAQETCWSPTLPSARQAALFMRGAMR